MDYKVEFLKVNDLKPYEKNAKKHPKEQVDMIAESIRQFGFRQNLVVDADNCVVIGHGRLLAAKQLGLDAVPCVRAEDLTEQQIKALRLADNKVAESEWDLDLLDAELGEILDVDMKGFGFAESIMMDFAEFDGDGDGGGSVMMNGSKLRVVIGAFMCDIDEDQNSLYEISRKLNDEKVKAFISTALKNGDLS